MLPTGGQSFEDKLYAMKYLISGQGLSFVVLKATTSELIGPKKKHLNYLVGLTNEPNVSIPSLVKHLMRRARHQEWSIAFKSVITIHYLTSYGNEKFIQNLASSTVNNRSFDYLSSFVDRSTTLAYDMSTFLRRYSRYINVKIQTYRQLGTDFCRIYKGNMQTFYLPPAQTLSQNQQQSPKKLKYLQSDQLVKTIPLLQKQFDALLAFDASSKDLNNGIINTAFSMLYKDFVKLYIAYQTTIIRLLELYFNVNQVKRARELLDLYRKFLVRMNKVCDFIDVIDSVGMDKSDMPSVSKTPELQLSLLEKHLTNLETSSNRRANFQASSSQFQSVELPRIDYGTLGRRRSLRASPSTPRRQQQQQFTESLLSPLPKSQKRRLVELGQLTEELGADKKLKDMMGIEKLATTQTESNGNSNLEALSVGENVSPSVEMAADASGDKDQLLLLLSSSSSSSSSSSKSDTNSVSKLNQNNEEPSETTKSNPNNWVQLEFL